MRRLVRIVVIAATAFAGLAVVASPAGAAPPQRESLHDEFSFEIDCGTFVLHEDVVLDVRTTFFVDQNGDPLTIQSHIRYAGVITNPAGEKFRDAGHWTDFVDLAGTPDDESDDIIAQKGLIFAITVPGQGIVAHDTGVIIFYLATGEVVIHGPHEVFQQGDSLLCSALG
jgi:hypothetical protein